MNAAVLVLVLVAVANPARRRAALSCDDTSTVATGALLGLGAVVGLAAVASPLIDALDVSRPNLRISAGLVLAIAALYELVWRVPPPGPALPGRGAAVVPVFFPVLVRPELGLAALVVGADLGMGWAAGAGALAMGLVVAWHALATPRGGGPVFERVEHGLARLVAGAQAALAIVVTAEGIFAI